MRPAIGWRAMVPARFILSKLLVTSYKAASPPTVIFCPPGVIQDNATRFEKDSTSDCATKNFFPAK